MKGLVLRKKVWFTAILLVGCLGLTGCGGTSDTSEELNVYELQSVKAVEESNQERIQTAFPEYDFKNLDKNIDVLYKQGQTSYMVECNVKDLEEFKSWVTSYVELSPITIGETGELSENLWSGVDTVENEYVFFDMSVLENQTVRLVLSKG